jgi:tyrosyl-tRNA synthetase
MSEIKSEFLRTIVERQYLHQATDLEALDTLAKTERLTAYVGYDCTAPRRAFYSRRLLPTPLAGSHAGGMPL